jgi:predicted small lipoprotein YifL
VAKHLFRIALAAALAASLAACTTGGPMPVPSASPTPDNETQQQEPEVDPRCLKEYPGTELVLYEGDLPVRPEFWPTPPPFAVLCGWSAESAVETWAYYATDEHMTMNQIYSYYEQQFDSPDRTVVHGRAPTADGDVLTGVYPPVSFYIEEHGYNRYKIAWALDGDYDYDN